MVSFVQADGDRKADDCSAGVIPKRLRKNGEEWTNSLPLPRSPRIRRPHERRIIDPVEHTRFRPLEMFLLYARTAFDFGCRPRSSDWPKVNREAGNRWIQMVHLSLITHQDHAMASASLSCRSKQTSSFLPQRGRGMYIRGALRRQEACCQPNHHDASNCS